jgi:hypothetical protein
MQVRKGLLILHLKSNQGKRLIIILYLYNGIMGFTEMFETSAAHSKTGK